MKKISIYMSDECIKESKFLAHCPHSNCSVTNDYILNFEEKFAIEDATGNKEDVVIFGLEVLWDENPQDKKDFTFKLIDTKSNEQYNNKITEEMKNNALLYLQEQGIIKFKKLENDKKTEEMKNNSSLYSEEQGIFSFKKSELVVNLNLYLPLTWEEDMTKVKNRLYRIISNAMGDYGGLNSEFYKEEIRPT